VDILYTADQQGVPANDSAVRSLMQQDRNEMMASDQAVLGDSGLRQLKQYNRALPVAWVVNQVAMDVALTPRRFPARRLINWGRFSPTRAPLTRVVAQPTRRPSTGPRRWDRRRES